MPARRKPSKAGSSDDFKSLDRAKQRIIKPHRDDIRKHAGSDALWVEATFAKYPSQLHTPYVVHPNDLKVEDGIVFVPLYMTPFL